MICLWWVDVDFEFYENFVGMYYIDNIEVLIICNVIKDVFYRFNLFFDCICG